VNRGGEKTTEVREKEEKRLLRLLVKSGGRMVKRVRLHNVGTPIIWGGGNKMVLFLQRRKKREIMKEIVTNEYTNPAPRGGGEEIVQKKKFQGKTRDSG